MDISVTVYFFCLCVCTVMDFSAEDKASGIKFCTAVHRRPRQGISHFCELCSPNSDAVWGTDSCGPKELRIGWEPRSSTGRSNFEEAIFGPLISIGSLCCDVCSKRGHLFVNNGTQQMRCHHATTVRLLQPAAMLQTGRCHITISTVKNLRAPAMLPDTTGGHV